MANIKKIKIPGNDVAYDIQDANAVQRSGDTMTGDLTVGAASLGTNGYVTGTWLKTTANIHLASTPANIAVLSNGLIHSRTLEELKTDLAIPSNLDAFVMAVDAGAITDTVPETFGGHVAGDFSLKEDIVDNLTSTATNAPLSANMGKNLNDKITMTNGTVGTLNSEVSTLKTNVSTLNTTVGNKLDKSGGTLTGALVAQNNVNYTTRQVRNVIMSTVDPTANDGQNGDLWIKYS